MLQCTGCNRHLLNDTACPFCARPPARRTMTLGALVMGVMTPVVLAACYGAPPFKDTSLVDTGVTDIDGDGFDSTADCDDGDETVNPGAAEVCDDSIDNDCDGLIDDDDPDCAG